MSKPRPRWANRLKFWLTDTQYDRLIRSGAPDGWRWNWRDRAETTGLAVLCHVFGHEPVADQCDKPEHDFCVHVFWMHAWSGRGQSSSPVHKRPPKSRSSNLHAQTSTSNTA